MVRGANMPDGDCNGRTLTISETQTTKQARCIRSFPEHPEARLDDLEPGAGKQEQKEGEVCTGRGTGVGDKSVSAGRKTTGEN